MIDLVAGLLYTFYFKYPWRVPEAYLHCTLYCFLVPKPLVEGTSRKLEPASLQFLRRSKIHENWIWIMLNFTNCHNIPLINSASKLKGLGGHWREWILVFYVSPKKSVEIKTQLWIILKTFVNALPTSNVLWNTSYCSFKLRY